MRFTRQWRLLIMAILALLLVSCGSATAPAAPEAAPAEEEAAPAAQEEEAAPPAEEEAASGEKVKITWWEQPPEDQYRELLLKEFVGSFNAAHDDIELEFVFQEDLDRVLRTAIQGGAAPDIIFTPGPSFVLEYVNAGFILPLDEYAQQYGWQDKVLEWAYDSGKVQGKLYSLPLTYETMVLYYNKTLFEEKGWSPPTNRAEVEKLCEAADAEGLIFISRTPINTGKGSTSGWWVSSTTITPAPTTSTLPCRARSPGLIQSSWRLTSLALTDSVVSEK